MNISLPLNGYNESDVREEVIAPLLRRLGYRSGSANNIIREQFLRYPRLSLGLRNPKKDPELRGKADYILEVDKRHRWVIEAKGAEVTISDNDIEQAWTYANHPEVRALYFVLCNGRILLIHKTAHGPGAAAVLSLTYEQLQSVDGFQCLANLLGPEALVRDFPEIKIDVGVPIVPGLRSVARITNGVIRYEKNSLELPFLNELHTSIQEGAVERDDAGRLVVFVKTLAPSRSLQEFNERLGLSTFELVSESTRLSTDAQRPSVFVYDNRIILPAGERILDLRTWTQVEIPFNLTCDLKARAEGSFEKGMVSGIFTTDMQYLQLSFNLRMSGSFELHLS
jgi:hypothetical protein